MNLVLSQVEESIHIVEVTDEGEALPTRVRLGSPDTPDCVLWREASCGMRDADVGSFRRWKEDNWRCFSSEETV